MPTAVREQIAAAFTALLTGASLKDASNRTVKIERNRDADQDYYPALAIMEGNQVPREVSYGQTDYTMQIAVHGFVQASDGASLGAAINDLYAKVVQTCLAGERKLGGICHDIREGNLTTDYALDSSQRTGTFELVFEVDYWASNANPYSQAVPS